MRIDVIRRRGVGGRGRPSDVAEQSLRTLRATSKPTAATYGTDLSHRRRQAGHHVPRHGTRRRDVRRRRALWYPQQSFVLSGDRPTAAAIVARALRRRTMLRDAVCVLALPRVEKNIRGSGDCLFLSLSLGGGKLRAISRVVRRLGEFSPLSVILYRALRSVVKRWGRGGE